MSATPGTRHELGLEWLGMPQPGLRRLWAAVQALAEQWRRRRGPAGAWWITNLITGGKLLATNRSTPLEAKASSGWTARKSNLEVPDDS